MTTFVEIAAVLGGIVLAAAVALFLVLRARTRKSYDEFKRTMALPLQGPLSERSSSLSLPCNRIKPPMSEERPTTALKPGEHHVMSFQSGDPSAARQPCSGPPLCRVIVWNVERGLELPRIIAELRRLDADVLLLQELDAHCSRTRDVDVATRIAQAIGMQVCFAKEFEEVASAAREALPDKRVGAGPGHSHGNAILIPSVRAGACFVDTWSFLHAAQPFDWTANGDAKYNEPRVGGRVCLGAHVRIPARPSAAISAAKQPAFHELVVYCLHLENNGGPSGRWAQFREACADASDRRRAGLLPAAAPVVVGGDLNTLASGVAKLLPRHFDGLALRRPPLEHEAQLWARELLPAAARGCGLRLDDPFPKGRDGATAVHAHGVYRAKLDWLLVEAGPEAGPGLPGTPAEVVVPEVASHAVGGVGISDHMWLRADLDLAPAPKGGLKGCLKKR